MSQGRLMRSWLVLGALSAVMCASGCKPTPAELPDVVAPDGGSDHDPGPGNPATPPADTPVPTPDGPPADDDTPADPCAALACQPNASCEPSIGTCECNPGFVATPAGACTAVNEHQDFIGAACTQDADCPYAGGVCETAGFPNGHCSKPCDRVCPDSDDSPTTFCAVGKDRAAASCFSRCDFARYPYTAGCRPDYVCANYPRANEPTVQQPICVPKSWASPIPCADPTNFAQDDACYMNQIAFGDMRARLLAEKILAGEANASEAMEFLDLNYAGSVAWVRANITGTIHPNSTPGHSASKPMRGMVVHYTASQREDGTIRYFASDDPHASTHFIVGSYRNGLVVQLFPHSNRTWHAGNNYNPDHFGFDFANAGYLRRSNGKWVDYAGRAYALSLPVFGNEPLNIEDGIPGRPSKYRSDKHWQPYTYYQLLSFVLVSRALLLAYGDLDPTAFVRHGDISDSRVDPGPALPTTALVALVYSMADVFTTPWLNDYKTDPRWIIDHPDAR